MLKSDFASIKISGNYSERLLTSEGTSEVTCFFPLALSLRVQYSSSLERTIGSFFLAYLKVLTQTDYPLHTSLIKLISIIVRPGGGWFETIVFPHSDLLILCISVFCGHRKSIFLAASEAVEKHREPPGRGLLQGPSKTSQALLSCLNICSGWPVKINDAQFANSLCN